MDIIIVVAHLSDELLINLTGPKNTKDIKSTKKMINRKKMTKSIRNTRSKTHNSHRK